MKSESEIIRFIQTWILVYMSLTYTFFVGKHVSPGKIRFLLIFPVVILFLILPFRLTSLNLGGFTVFMVGWLATFKLILFIFNKPPLSSSSSLIQFIAAASLPIEITPSSKLDPDPVSRIAIKSDPDAPIWKKWVLKVALMAVVLKLFDYRTRLHPTVLLSVYCFHIYFLLELTLAVLGAAVRAGFGLELEPQFNEPYLATSLRDFWGRRWNLVVTSILRPTVYLPVMGLLKSSLGQDIAQSLATLATFGVSAIMHEYVMYYLNRMYPSGKMAAFFLLHGLCVVAETAVARRMKGKWRVPRVVASGLTILFVMSTAFWLFFPDFIRGKADVRGIQEYAELGEFFERVTNGEAFRSFDGIASVEHFLKQLFSY